MRSWFIAVKQIENPVISACRQCLLLAGLAALTEPCIALKACVVAGQGLVALRRCASGQNNVATLNRAHLYLKISSQFLLFIVLLGMKTENNISILLDKVINDLEARQDYSSVKFQFIDSEQSITAVNAVQSYNSFKQEIFSQQSNNIPITVLSIDEVINITNAIIASNVAIQKMGQLNTNRTITPSTAKEDNVTLKALFDELMKLKATTQTGEITPSSIQKIYGPKGT